MTDASMCAASASRARRAPYLTLLLALLLASSFVTYESRAQAADGEIELPPRAAERVPYRERPIQVYGGPRLLLAGRSDALPAEFGTGLGFQLGAAQYWEYAGIGAELRFAWLNAFESEPSLRSLELLLKPSLGFSLERLPLRLYAAAPFGLSLTLMPRAAGFGVPSSSDGVLGPALGATAFVWRRLGVNAEAGYQWIGPRSDVMRRELTLALNLVYGL